jgi:hypothetical protein
MDYSLEERDRRRPIAWDWLLCFLTPLQIIAYHHRRARIGMGHVCVLVLTAFVINVLTWYASVVSVKEVLGLMLKGTLKGEKKAGLTAVFERFEKMTEEQRQALIISFFDTQSPVLGFIGHILKVFRFFGTALIGLALYVVFSARTGTRIARQELVQSYLMAGYSAAPIVSMHPLLASPKGQGDVLFAYIIAFLSPASSYALNSDRRRVFFGIGLLNALLSGGFLFSGFCATVFLMILGEEDQELSLLVAGRLGFVTLVLFILWLAFPVRMAIANVQKNRQKYGQTLVFQ